MQIGGVGSGHDSSSHHVTNCLHDHGKKMEADGAMKSRSFTGGSGAGSAQVRQTAQSFSLSAWLADPIGKAKKMFGKIWRGEHDSGDGTSGKVTSGSERMMAELAEDLLKEDAVSGSTAHGDMPGQSAQPQQQVPSNVLHNPQIAAAATAVKPQDMLQGNPYFAAVENSSAQRQTIWQKMKVQFEAVTSFLAKRFAFSGKNSFQAKQEQPKEDLRKRSRYRGDKLDVECVLTDDSYLLDSYDRKGEYSQLSTKQ